MDVNVDAMIETTIESEHLGPRAHVGERGLRRFLHHVAELSGDSQLAASGDDRHLDAEQLSAKLRPRKPGRDPDLRHRLGRAVAELRNAEILAQARARNLDVRIAIGFDDLDRNLAADRRELPLEISDAAFPP